MTDHFAQRAADWDQPSKIAMTEAFVRELLTHIELDNNWKAMEIGAGTGLVGLSLLPRLKEIVFEDTSPAMLEVLKAKLQGGEPVEIVSGEVFDYKRRDIDLIFSLMAFHHIADIEKTLSHLSEITNPGAYVIIGDLVTEDGSFHHFEHIPHQGFETELLGQQFESAGFTVSDIHIYNTLQRERIPGKMSDYDQFMLIAKKI